jgi:hypothetical protein
MCSKRAANTTSLLKHPATLGALSTHSMPLGTAASAAAAAATEALDYLVARVQADYHVEAGAQQQQRRAVSMLVKPLGAPGEAAKNKAVEADS